MDNFRLKVEDTVMFKLSQNIPFKKGSYHFGTIEAVVPRQYAFMIKPSASAKGKLAHFLDESGLIKIEFRCCKVPDVNKCLAERERRRIARFNASLMNLKEKYGR